MRNNIKKLNKETLILKKEEFNIEHKNNFAHLAIDTDEV